MKALKRPCQVEVYTDSSYLADCVRSLSRKKSFRWGVEVGMIKNADLWREFLGLRKKHCVSLYKAPAASKESKAGWSKA